MIRFYLIIFSHFCITNTTIYTVFNSHCCHCALIKDRLVVPIISRKILMGRRTGCRACDIICIITVRFACRIRRLYGSQQSKSQCHYRYHCSNSYLFHICSFPSTFADAQIITLFSMFWFYLIIPIPLTLAFLFLSKCVNIFTLCDILILILCYILMSYDIIISCTIS